MAQMRAATAAPGAGLRKPETSPPEVEVMVRVQVSATDPGMVVFHADVVRASDGRVVLHTEAVAHRDGYPIGWHAATPFELIGPVMIGRVHFSVGPPSSRLGAARLSLAGWFRGLRRR